MYFPQPNTTKLPARVGSSLLLGSLTIPKGRPAASQDTSLEPNTNTSSQNAAATAKLMGPMCMLPLAEGGYVVGDQVTVRLVSEDGIVTTLAGGDEEGFADGVGAAARFNYITGVAPHPDGGWVVCDSCNQRIRRVLRDGTVSTLAGSDEVVDDDGAGAGVREDPGDLLLRDLLHCTANKREWHYCLLTWITLKR